MKKAKYFCFILSVTLIACSDDDGGLGTDFWGIPISGQDQIKNSEGQIVNQNNGPLKAYQVDSAFVQGYQDNQHIFKLYFNTSDSLFLVITKSDQDFNYHSDAEPSQNRILHAVFNRDTLEMLPSAVSIQPRPEYNGFHTVTNLHTVSTGTFNGTVNEVPLID